MTKQQKIAAIKEFIADSLEAIEELSELGMSQAVVEIELSIKTARRQIADLEK